MDDNNQKKGENQSPGKPILETVTVDENSPENLPIEETPEEISTPAVDYPREETGSLYATPPVFRENRKKYLLVAALGSLLFFVFFVLILNAFFSSRGSAKEVKLVYWGLWDQREIFQPLIDDYQRRYPHVKIEYIRMSPENYREKLLARSRLGQGPDIFRFHNTWLPQLREIVAPIPEEIMSSQEFEKIFYPIHQKDLKIDKYYYGIPLMIDSLVLVYNQDLFKKAGINSEILTWEEVTNIVPKLTVKDPQNNLITSGLAIGTVSNLEHFSDIFGLLLVQNGASITDLTSSEAVGALEVFRRFAEPPNEFWNEKMPNSINAFIQEKVAMIIVPSWQILAIKAANPDLNLKVTTVPRVPGSDLVSLATYWVEGVSRYSKDQVEAWRFLKFLIEKENLTKLYEITTRYRLFGLPYPRVDLRDLLVQNQYLGPVMKQADNLVSLPLISQTFDNGLNDKIISYLENAINSTIQGVSYEEALRTADQGVKQVFEKYNIN
ncbi:MAG: sugar ABC transporter substrate-binding protein [Patescibacteria group bacterium]|nr:sugar ABC transporter substrate-binding protein [Patescibacteria group bacterium]